MTALDQERIRSLASFKSESPVISVYVDVDGSRHLRPQEYEAHVDQMLRDAYEEMETHTKAVHDVFDRIDTFIKAGFDRSRVRGVAIFASCDGQLWEVIELPVPVTNHLVVNQTPHVRQLERVIDEFERFAVLLVDKQRARIFVFELGELVERSELFDVLPRREDDRGDKDFESGDHAGAVVHHHIKRSADVAFKVFQDQAFDHLIIAAPAALISEVEKELHSYLQARVAARLSIPVNARDEEIRQAALEVEATVERAKERRYVERLRDAVGAKSGGVTGMKDVLQALVERRVETLLVSDGYEEEGWRCPSCRFLGMMGPTCPACSAAMMREPDIVEEAVEEALNQSCSVDIVVGNPDLDVMGRIGALLRF